jgi:hypothetical protein
MSGSYLTTRGKVQSVFRRRDQLIVQLAGQLADSRAREAALRERLTWYQTVVGETPVPVLRAVPHYAPRDARLNCR